MRLVPVGTPTTASHTHSSSSFSIAVPDGVQVGEGLVLVYRNQSSTGTTFPSLPGFTQVSEVYSLPSARRINAILLRKIQSDADLLDLPSSVTLTTPTSGNNSRCVVAMTRVRLEEDDASAGAGFSESLTFGGYAPNFVHSGLDFLCAAGEFGGGNGDLESTPEGWTHLVTVAESGTSNTVLHVFWRRSTWAVTETTIDTVGAATAGAVTFSAHLRAEDFITASSAGAAAGGTRPLALPWGSLASDGTPGGYTISQMDADIAAGRTVYWAHRGGSANWSEMTMRAYTNAVWHGARVLEVSVHRSQDGVLIMSHDANLSRVTETDYVIASTPSSTLLGVPVDVPAPGGVIGRLEDLLNAYPGLVLLVDNKPDSFVDQFLALLQTVPNWQDRIVVKFDGQFGQATGAAAFAAGFATCCYLYESNYGGGRLETVLPYTTYLGLNYDASEGVWETFAATGKPLWAHVIPNTQAAAEALDKGAQILQCADVLGIIPAVNRLPS